ncbi:MAG: ribbon-helix-helix domain-containing protein [Vulcanococcus sp.]
MPFRSSKRLSITVAQSTLEALAQRSSEEGRSLSNLAAYLLESSLEQRFR